MITNEEQMTYVARGRSPWISTTATDEDGNMSPGTSEFVQTGVTDRQFFAPEGWTIDPETGQIVAST